MARPVCSAGVPLSARVRIRAVKSPRDSAAADLDDFAVVHGVDQGTTTRSTSVSSSTRRDRQRPGVVRRDSVLDQVTGSLIARRCQIQKPAAVRIAAAAAAAAANSKASRRARRRFPPMSPLGDVVHGCLCAGVRGKTVELASIAPETGSCESSFPRSAWECRLGRSASARWAKPRSWSDDAERREEHSHAERGNETSIPLLPSSYH